MSEWGPHDDDGMTMLIAMFVVIIVLTLFLT